MATTAPAQRTNAFSVQSAMYAVAGFAGSMLGGGLPGVIAALTGETLAQPAPYRWTLLLIPLLLLLPLRMQWRMREPDAHALVDDDPAAAAAHAALAPRRPLPSLPSTGRAVFYLIALFSLVRFLQVGGVGAATTFFNVYMDRELHVATGTIGLFQAVAKLLGVPIALAVPALARRYGNVALVLVASTLVGLSLLPMAWVPIWWVAGLSYIGIWICTPVRYTAYTVFAMERTPPGVRGTMNGAQEMLAGLSFAVIAFAGGFVINRFGYAPLFTAGALLTLIGVWLLAEFVRRERAQTHVTSPSP
jgi:predicted MFS family arabinose efflux permease